MGKWISIQNLFLKNDQAHCLEYIFLTKSRHGKAFLVNFYLFSFFLVADIYSVFTVIASLLINFPDIINNMDFLWGYGGGLVVDREMGYEPGCWNPPEPLA